MTRKITKFLIFLLSKVFVRKQKKKKKKSRANLNKPIYIGIKILDLSKVSM